MPRTSWTNSRGAANVAGRWSAGALVGIGLACVALASSACSSPTSVYISNETPRDVMVASAETPSKRVSVPSEKTRAVGEVRKGQDFLIYLVSTPAGESLGCIYLAVSDHPRSLTIPLAYLEPCAAPP